MEYKLLGLSSPEYLRGTELSPGDVESVSTVDASMPTHPTPHIHQAKPVSMEKSDSDRERQLELWMEEVKSFIRNIDISSL